MSNLVLKCKSDTQSNKYNSVWIFQKQRVWEKAAVVWAVAWDTAYVGFPDPRLLNSSNEQKQEGIWDRQEEVKREMTV